jgi:hypothetical protein
MFAWRFVGVSGGEQNNPATRRVDNGSPVREGRGFLEDFVPAARLILRKEKRHIVRALRRILRA